MKRTDAVRAHLEEAACLNQMATTAATADIRTTLLAEAQNQEGMADAARHGEYHVDLQD
jgi:hypothetical protein